MRILPGIPRCKIFTVSRVLRLTKCSDGASFGTAIKTSRFLVMYMNNPASRGMEESVKKVVHHVQKKSGYLVTACERWFLGLGTARTWSLVTCKSCLKR